MVAFIFLCFSGVSAYLHVLYSEKIICHPCMLNNLYSKNSFLLEISTENQADGNLQDSDVCGYERSMNSQANLLVLILPLQYLDRLISVLMDIR